MKNSTINVMLAFIACMFNRKLNIKTIIIENLTLTLVNGKLTQARNHKGRFVKLAIAQNALNRFNAEKLENVYDYIALSIMLTFPCLMVIGVIFA